MQLRGVRPHLHPLTESSKRVGPAELVSPRECVMLRGKPRCLPWARFEGVAKTQVEGLAVGLVLGASWRESPMLGSELHRLGRRGAGLGELGGCAGGPIGEWQRTEARAASVV